MSIFYHERNKRKNKQTIWHTEQRKVNDLDSERGESSQDEREAGGGAEEELGEIQSRGDSGNQHGQQNRRRPYARGDAPASWEEAMKTIDVRVPNRKLTDKEYQRISLAEQSEPRRLGLGYSRQFI